MSSQIQFPKSGGGDSDRRRSTRVLLVMPVEVKWVAKDGLVVQEQAETEVVSQHGAMLRMKARLAPGTQVELRRPSAHQAAKAKIVGVGNPSPDGLARVAVEMTVPSDAFWGVSFPAGSPAPNPAAGAKPPAGAKTSVAPGKPLPGFKLAPAR